MEDPAIVITAKGAARRRWGHPWIYRDDIETNQPSLSGEIISVVDRNKKFIGKAFYNHASKIALRFITEEDVPIDETFWRARLNDAVEYRKRIIKDANAYRISHAEADNLPALVVDRYGEHLCVQTLCLGMDKLKDLITGILVDLLKPSSVTARNDSSARKLEGLAEEKRILYGSIPRDGKIEVREGEIKYLVDVLEGQKTGSYLDQRENHMACKRYAKGKTLDCFAYQGLFSLHAATAAESVLAVDSSMQALERLKQNAALNSITNISAIEGNVFDILKSFQKEGRIFETIILDPPAFAKSKKDIENAARAYIDINLRAMRLLAKGGYLITCSCSYNFAEELFFSVVREALKESRMKARLIEKLIQPLDHPILPHFPESNYLKCFILEML